MTEAQNHEIKIQIPFPSNRLAQIAYDVLRVDDEPPRSQVTKTLSVNENCLKGEFISLQKNKAENAVYKFLDKVQLVGETLTEFGPPLSDEYQFA